MINKRKANYYFNHKLKPRSFEAGNLGLREKGTTMQEEGKLGPQWEGPYLVVTNN